MQTLILHLLYRYIFVYLLRDWQMKTPIKIRRPTISIYNFTGVIFTVGFLVAVILAAWIVLIEIEQRTKVQVQNSLQTVLQTTQEAIYMWINHRMQDALENASSLKVRELTQALLKEKPDLVSLSRNPTQSQLRDYVRPKLLKYSDKGFFIISPDRVNIASMRDDNLGAINLIHHQSKKNLGRAFKGDTVFIAPVHSDVPLRVGAGILENQLPTTFVVAPIRDETFNVISVIALRIDPFINLTRIAQLGRIGDSGETYAFNRKGVMITESRFDHQLRQIGLLKVLNKCVSILAIFINRKQP